MGEVGWTGVFTAVAVLGVVIAVARRSRTWLSAGIAFALGGIGYAGYYVIVPYPPVGTAADVGVWFGVVGFFFLVAATILTLVAMGPHGRRRFLVILAVATLAVGTYLFWTSNWAARFADVPSRCIDTGHHFGPRDGVQRIPPGVRCFNRIAQTRSGPMPTEEVWVQADAVSWLALAGWSVVCGFVMSFPLMGLAWPVRRRPALALP
jgi:hypothetical protein